MRLLRRIRTAWRLYVLRDPVLREAMRWRREQGDGRLRLDYPLDRDSIVFDVGGYLGDFAAQIQQRYGCRVFVFEPVRKFFDHCVQRFIDLPQVRCFNYGLSAVAGRFAITQEADGSSLTKASQSGPHEWVEVRRFADVVEELGLARIDLLKLNIEGGEFDVLPHLIDSGLMQRVRFLQVQFHNFVPDAVNRRERIRERLRHTHDEMWNYPFVWESWRIRN